MSARSAHAVLRLGDRREDRFTATFGSRRGAERAQCEASAQRISWERDAPWPTADHVLHVAGRDDAGRELAARVACPGQMLHHGELNRTRRAMIDFLSVDPQDNYGVMVSWRELLQEDILLLNGARISGARRVTLVRAILEHARTATP